MTVLCYTLPMLLQAGRELAAGSSGTACAAYLGVFLLLILGSSAYSGKWPERWSPGTFDLIGNSHQVSCASPLRHLVLRVATLLKLVQAALPVKA